MTPALQGGGDVIVEGAGFIGDLIGEELVVIALQGDP